MINFKAFYAFLFKSFDVERDIAMIERLQNEGHDAVLLVKRSWLYGLFTSFWLLPLITIAFVNGYLILQHFEYSTFGIVLASLLGFTIVNTAYSHLRYVFAYRAAYSESSRIYRVKELSSHLSAESLSFVKCFNQLQFNFAFFIGIIATYAFHIFFVSQFATGMWAALDIICIIIQLTVIHRIIRYLIDLEMDFGLVAPGKVYFINQHGMYAEISTIESEKVRTVRSSYPNPLASLLDYGTVEVLVGGEEESQHTFMEYVGHPEETVENMSSLLMGRQGEVPRVHNHYLEKILGQSNGLDPMERKEKVLEYLKVHEAEVKADYEHAEDPEMKKEIEEIYEEYYEKK